MREPYNTASITELAATPGTLKRLLRKGDVIYTSQEDRPQIEKFLRIENVRFTSAIEAYDLSVVTIS